MSEQAIMEAFRSVEYFHGIADEHLERLAKISRLVEYPANTDIFREYEEAKDVYAIVSGKVSLVICTPNTGCRQLMEATDGELIGWSPLVERPRLSDTARTLTSTKAIAIDGHKILELCDEDHEFGYQFMRRAAKVLANRLSATRLQLLDIGGGRLPQIALESD
jgi:CRP/FNR family cyclic AMP-dependent transcriptional regulator